MAIPKVRTWYVRYYDEKGACIARRKVMAPNRVLARLNLWSAPHPANAARRTITVRPFSILEPCHD